MGTVSPKGCKSPAGKRICGLGRVIPSEYRVSENSRTSRRMRAMVNGSALDRKGLSACKQVFSDDLDFKVV